MESAKYERLAAVNDVVAVLKRYRDAGNAEWFDLADVLETAGKIVLERDHVRVEVSSFVPGCIPG